MRPTLAFVVLGFLCCAAAETQTVAVDLYDAPAQTLPFMPAFLIEVPETLFAKTPFTVKVHSVGLGRRVVLARRMTDGNLVVLGGRDLDVAGNASFRVVFEGEGAQNLLVWIQNASGAPVALDGVIRNVRTCPTDLGADSTISGEAPKSSYYYYED